VQNCVISLFLKTKLHKGHAQESKGLCFHVRNQAPIYFQKFQPRIYTQSELLGFTGEYVSEELGVDYRILAEGGQLAVYTASGELVRLSSVMEDVFNDEHFGYLRFEHAVDGRVKGLTVNDELARDIAFVRKK
ncbi:MAG: hypothetical protein AAFV07_21550, partial [Bacteroidota bacterium]